jgi:hypothetical protein
MQLLPLDKLGLFELSHSVDLVYGDYWSVESVLANSQLSS